MRRRGGKTLGFQERERSPSLPGRSLSKFDFRPPPPHGHVTMANHTFSRAFNGPALLYAQLQLHRGHSSRIEHMYVRAHGQRTKGLFHHSCTAPTLSLDKQCSRWTTAEVNARACRVYNDRRAVGVRGHYWMLVHNNDDNMTSTFRRLIVGPLRGRNLRVLFLFSAGRWDREKCHSNLKRGPKTGLLLFIISSALS